MNCVRSLDAVQGVVHRGSSASRCLTRWQCCAATHGGVDVVELGYWIRDGRDVFYSTVEAITGGGSGEAGLEVTSTSTRSICDGPTRASCIIAESDTGAQRVDIVYCRVGSRIRVGITVDRVVLVTDRLCVLLIIVIGTVRSDCLR